MMLLPYCSGRWVQGSQALCFRGAAGVQPGSGIWGSKSSQHNHSFPGLAANSLLLAGQQFTEAGHLGYSAFVTLILPGRRARSWAQQCLFTWVLLQGHSTSGAWWKGRRIVSHAPAWSLFHQIPPCQWAASAAPPCERIGSGKKKLLGISGRTHDINESLKAWIRK